MDDRPLASLRRVGEIHEEGKDTGAAGCKFPALFSEIQEVSGTPLLFRVQFTLHLTNYL